MGKSKKKNKNKAPAAGTVATKTEGLDMYKPTIKTVETAEAAREKGIGDLPDISAKIPVGLKKESAVVKSEAPKPGKKKWYAVVKGFPLADTAQDIKYVPGVPQASVMTRWLRAQLNAGLLVEIDPLDTDPKKVAGAPKEGAETTD